MRRYEQRWREWDAARARGEAADVLIGRLDNEAILQLMASGDVTTRRYELNLLVTEMLNRVSRLDTRLREALGEVEPVIEQAEDAAANAEAAATRSEGAITRHLDTRRDPLADEREAAHDATTAARETREAIERLHGPRERLSEAQRGLRGTRPDDAARAQAAREE